MAFYDGWKPYVPVEKRRRQAAREAATLQKKGQTVSPVVVEGRAIARTFWGKAWCENLERYSDYENRLPRGRTYVRNGSVIDLQIAPGEVKALVSGSDLYKVRVKIAPVEKARWESICKDCAGEIDSLIELLQGRFSKGVMERVCREKTGLFPAPGDIVLSCSCPDWADMCKHVAAVLYGIGARLDAQPDLLFRLHDVDEKELIAGAGKAVPLTRKAPAAGKVLADEDLSALFGVEIDTGGAEETVAPRRSGKRTAAVKKSACGKAFEKGGGFAEIAAIEKEVRPGTSFANPKTETDLNLSPATRIFRSQYKEPHIDRWRYLGYFARILELRGNMSPIGDGYTVIAAALEAIAPESITVLLHELGQGNRDVEDRLAKYVYAELRRVAARHMRRERSNHTLQATALVNEAWLRLMDQPNPDWGSRAHFFAIASRLMRQILVDHARRRLAEKRGGELLQVTLQEPLFAVNYNPVDLLALDEALERFRKVDARGSRILELHFFGGLSFGETALILEISPRTVKRNWSVARAWLHDELSGVS